MKRSSVVASTRRTYAGVWRRWCGFCHDFGVDPEGALEAAATMEEMAVLFVVFRKDVVAPSTVASELSAISWYFRRVGRVSPANPRTNPDLAMCLAGVKLTHARPLTKKSPVSVELLHYVRQLGGEGGTQAVAAAAVIVAFFACLRGNEVAPRARGSWSVANPGGFDGGRQLRRKDVSVGADVVHIFVSSSKRDQTGMGSTVTLRRVRHALCPVAAVERALALGLHRGPEDALFQNAAGLPLLLRELEAHLRGAAAFAGVADVTSFTPHSMRIGAVNCLRQAGFGDAFIMAFGRWASEAMQAYKRAHLHDFNFNARGPRPDMQDAVGSILRCAVWRWRAAAASRAASSPPSAR